MTRTRTIARSATVAVATLTGAAALALGATDGPTTPTAAAAPTTTEAPATAAATPRPTPPVPTRPATVEAPTGPDVEAPSTVDRTDARPSPISPANPPDGPGLPAVPAGPAHEILPGTGVAPPPSPAGPIGALHDFGVPDLGLAAPTGGQAGHGGHAGPGDKAVAPSCSHQCITKSVAFPRGFGAELTVETSVPADLFLSAVADLDGNGDFETSYFEWSPPGVQQHTWLLDHLEPGTTYHVMVAATDADGHTAHAWGEFTTLSQRTVHVELGAAEITGGPGDILATYWELALGGSRQDVTPGQQGILLYPDLPRFVDAELRLSRLWRHSSPGEPCEVVDASLPQGHNSCEAWNTASFGDIDLDTVPAGAGHWTQSSVQVDLHTPTGAGGALPAGYGDPYWFHIAVPVTLHVTYS